MSRSIIIFLFILFVIFIFGKGMFDKYTSNPQPSSSSMKSVSMQITQPSNPSPVMTTGAPIQTSLGLLGSGSKIPNVPMIQSYANPQNVSPMNSNSMPSTDMPYYGSYRALEHTPTDKSMCSNSEPLVTNLPTIPTMPSQSNQNSKCDRTIYQVSDLISKNDKTCNSAGYNKICDASQYLVQNDKLMTSNCMAGWSGENNNNDFALFDYN